MKTKDGKERRTKTAPAGWRRRLSFAVGGLLSFFLIGLSVLSAAENGNVAEKLPPAVEAEKLPPAVEAEKLLPAVETETTVICKRLWNRTNWTTTTFSGWKTPW